MDDGLGFQSQQKTIGPTKFHREWKGIDHNQSCNVQRGTKRIFFERCTVSDIDRLIGLLTNGSNSSSAADFNAEQIREIFGESLDELLKESDNALDVDRAAVSKLLDGLISQHQEDLPALYLMTTRDVQRYFVEKQPKSEKAIFRKTARALFPIYQSKMRTALLPKIVGALNELKKHIHSVLPSHHSQIKNAGSFITKMGDVVCNTVQRIALLEFYEYRAECPAVRRIRIVSERDYEIGSAKCAISIFIEETGAISAKL